MGISNKLKEIDILEVFLSEILQEICPRGIEYYETLSNIYRNS